MDRLRLRRLKSSTIALGAAAILMPLAPVAVSGGDTKVSKDFASVPLGSFLSHPCSPTFERFDLDVKGIKINMPSSIEIVADEEGEVLQSVWPVCITIQAPQREFGGLEPLQIGGEITLVAVDVSSGQSYGSDLSTEDLFTPLESVETMTDEEIDQTVERFYMNVDLCEYINLPARPAIYDAHATYHEFRSDSKRVKVE